MLIAVQCSAEQREDVGVHLALQPLFLSSARLLGTTLQVADWTWMALQAYFTAFFFPQGARVSQGTMRHQPDRVPGNGGLVVTSE